MALLKLDIFNNLLPKENLLYCFLITGLGAILRFYNYTILPPDNWTSDEYAFAWSGMSILQQGVPTSWSWLTPSDNFPTVVWPERNLRFRLVTPWFDHPPLFGLLVGLAAIIGGARTFFQCNLYSMRFPSLLLGIACLLLVYIIAYKLFNTPVAVIAGLLYATNPNTVFLSRLAISENLVVFFALLVILLYWYYHQTQNARFLWVAAVCAGLATLAKVTAIYLPVLLVFLLIFDKKWRNIPIVLAIGLGLTSLYYLYGNLYYHDFFVSIIHEQSLRFESFNFLQYFILPKVFFEDGWLILGLLSLVLILKDGTENISNRLITFPIFLYALTLIFTGAQSHYFTWYTIPFYPFVFIALAIFMGQFSQSPNLVWASLIFITAGIWLFNLTLSGWVLESPTGRYYFMLVTALILTMYLLYDIGKLIKKPTINYVNSGLFALLLLGNLYLVFNYKFTG
ncbi:MAG: hypothetical protein N5P05_003752 [Chroococcopsis gigantea SAG 12.99]|jgi:4-amino-4-deoxy-L-arabinose transferase-like glycosyltransferase|nr:glycosyltransferase family 39 protein [Chlorogloea purpurea SAG 13.99]MDV3002146.1 hypothetical protein [Chroococcopsis gigantea SAG 12.99]